MCCEWNFFNETECISNDCDLFESSHIFYFFFLRGKASRVHVCKVLLPSTLKMRGICHDESSEGSVMAVIEGVKSNITPGMLSNGWV